MLFVWVTEYTDSSSKDSFGHYQGLQNAESQGLDRLVDSASGSPKTLIFPRFRPFQSNIQALPHPAVH